MNTFVFKDKKLKIDFFKHVKHDTIRQLMSFITLARFKLIKTALGKGVKANLKHQLLC